MSKQTYFTKAVYLGSVEATQVDLTCNSHSSKIPRIDFASVCAEAYVELDSWANKIRSTEFAGRKVTITTELQYEDPTAPLVVPGLYLVCTVTGSKT